jgi:hypothetical protein
MAGNTAATLATRASFFATRELFNILWSFGEKKRENIALSFCTIVFSAADYM